MAYDDVIILMGGFGRYQLRIYLLLCVPIISCAFHIMSGVFLAAKTDFRCLLPNENPENAIYNLSSNITNMSYFSIDETRIWPKCERYDYVNITDQHHGEEGNASLIMPTIKCDAFVYDKSTYQLTTTMEFNLVCDNEWLGATADSVFMLGVLLGAIIYGALSDRYGRKPTYYLAIIIELISGIIIALSPEFISYTIFRFVLASAVTGLFSIGYVIVVEMIGPQRRLLGVIGLYLSFSSGYILTAGFAYLITNWRILQIVITAPSLVFLSYWWFIPESVRWLLNKGCIQEARALIEKASTVNGIELSKEQLDNVLSNSNAIESDVEKVVDKASVLDLFRYPNLRKRSLLLFFSWFVISGTYYGLSWNTSNLGGNDYINFIISAAAEVPAHIFVFFTLDRWGRRIVLSGCIIFAGVTLLLTTLIPDDMSWLAVTLAMSGKSAITGAFGSVYIFTSEQFPTAVRNVGLGSCSTFARIAGMLVPYINYTSNIWKPLPLVIFGTGSIIAGPSILLLPETLNEKLPETIEDGELFGKGKKLTQT